jgi:UDP-N-acetyl-D-galactosamine dehydrogenase
LEYSPEQLKEATPFKYSNQPENFVSPNLIITFPSPIDLANHPNMTPLFSPSETFSKVLKMGYIEICESTI